MRARSTSVFFFGAFVAACASTPEGPSAQPFATEPLTWSACAPPNSTLPLECAWVEVPRRWSDPTGTKVIVGIRRVRASGASRGQLWALDGGPGFAGDAFLQPEFAQLAAEASLDLVIPAHRGVVGSAVACPGIDLSQPDPWPACVQTVVNQWGPGADGFDSTSAALDVAHLMERAPTAGERVVFGGSYGSLWGQRLLQAKPTGIDRMWLDSIVDLEGTLERADEHADAAMRTLLDQCGRTPDCAAMFNGAPTERARTVLSRYLNEDGCGQADGIRQAQLQTLMYAWLSGPPAYWALAAAGYARADRCTAADVAALKRAIDRLSSGRAPDGAGFTYNIVLNRQILYRELYLFDVDVEQRTAAQDTLLATRRGDIAVAGQANAFGPSWRQTGTSTVPATETDLVLLSGHLDPLDPPVWAVRTSRRWPSATLISVPWAGHSVLRYIGTGPDECGSNLLAGFLAGEPLSTECVDAVTGPDFSGDAPATVNAAQDWFGAPLF